MAKKISELPPAQIPNDADMYPVVQAAQTRRQTLSQLKAALGTDSANVQALAGLSGAANRLPLFTAPGSMTTQTLSPYWQTVLDEVDAAASRTALGVIGPTAGKIEGFDLFWNGPASIVMSSGAAWIPGLNTLVNASSSIVKSSLVLSANTWYHVYLFVNAGIPDIEIVTTAPSAKYFGTARTKTGDTSRRYLRSFRTAAANTIIRDVQNGNLVSYMADISTAPLSLLANGTAVTSTSVAATAAAPVTSTHGVLTVLNAAANAVVLYLAAADAAIAASGSFNQMIVSQNQQFSMQFPLGTGQTFVYTYSGAPGASGAYIRLAGYLFER